VEADVERPHRVGEIRHRALDGRAGDDVAIGSGRTGDAATPSSASQAVSWPDETA
jgi:hypothetical protein